MRSPLPLLLLLSATSAWAAQWQPVASAKGERVDIDKSRIQRNVQGGTTAWARLSFGREMTDGNTTFTAVQALNRYDCAGGRFTTVRRVYLSGEQASRVVKEESVASPKAMVAAPGSVDEKLLAEACRLRTVGDARKVADAVARLAQQGSSQRGGPMYADMRSDGPGNTARSATVADGVRPDIKPSGRPKFFDLPAIDKSQAEDPHKGATATATEAKPAEVKAAETKTAETKTAEAKPAATKPTPAPAPATTANRRELEHQYATSGPRRVTTRRKVPPTPAPEPAHPIHWSYEGEGGPANWAKLKPEYATCGTGNRQSPIDIREGIQVDLEPIQFDYRPSQFRIVDNGHTIQVNVSEGNTMTIMGREYELLQFHFHRPSEERVNGKAYDMTIHFVHKDGEGRLGVVAVLLEKGSEHPIIQTLWNHMPLEENQEVTPAEAIDLNGLLPVERDYYTYMGSLTTPPCTEGVLWMVFKQPVQISAEQVAIFARLYRNNARPVQPGNNRLVKSNR